MAEIIICPHCGERILIVKVPDANDGNASMPVIVKKG